MRTNHLGQHSKVFLDARASGVCVASQNIQTNDAQERMKKGKLWSPKSKLFEQRQKSNIMRDEEGIMDSHGPAQDSLKVTQRMDHTPSCVPMGTHVECY